MLFNKAKKDKITVNLVNSGLLSGGHHEGTISINSDGGSGSVTICVDIKVSYVPKNYALPDPDKNIEPYWHEGECNNFYSEDLNKINDDNPTVGAQSVEDSDTTVAWLKWKAGKGIPTDYHSIEIKWKLHLYSDGDIAYSMSSEYGDGYNEEYDIIIVEVRRGHEQNFKTFSPNHQPTDEYMHISD